MFQIKRTGILLCFQSGPVIFIKSEKQPANIVRLLGRVTMPKVQFN